MGFFYLSQLLNKPVYTSGGDRVARLKDLVARLEATDTQGEVTLEAYPPISGLVVELAAREIFVPWAQVNALDPDGARLSKSTISLLRFERREGEVLLYRDILDKQLIDIDGRRVIRANDLQLSFTAGQLRLTAVDVSAEAVLRRLTFGLLFGNADGKQEALAEENGNKRRRRRSAPAKLINWADVEMLAGDIQDVRLRQSHERLALLHPVDIAHILDDLSYVQGAEIIGSLDDETAADTLQEMDEERQADIVESMDRERAADILEEMDPDDAADLLADLDQAQARDLLDRMEDDEAEDVEELLAYEENSAGGIMTSDFVTVPARWTVDETIAFMRTLDEPPDLIDYLYVVEEDEPTVDWAALAQEGGRRLLGIVSLRDLLLSNGDRTLGALMTPDFVSVGPHDTSDKAAHLIAEYNLMALPVLDEHECLLGIITVDDALEVVMPERWTRRLPRVFG